MRSRFAGISALTSIFGLFAVLSSFTEAALSSKVQDTMNDNVIIHFKFQGRMYSLLLNTPVPEITLWRIEERIYKKLELDASKVKVELSYIPLLVGCEEQLTICDDEDMRVYLTFFDKEKRRCVLFVEAIPISELPEQLSIVGRSYVGMNYDEPNRNDAVMEANAIAPYVDNEQANQEHELMEEEDNGDTTRDDCVDKVMDRLDLVDEYVERSPFAESSQFLEAWEDDLGLSLRQEFTDKQALQDLVEKTAFVNSFGYAIIKSDTTRWVVKCAQPNCKWGLRSTRIPEKAIFSIRTYTKMNTCSRASQSTSDNQRKGSAHLVASLLSKTFTGKLETPLPKVIVDLVRSRYGVKISYSTALRGKHQVVCDLRGCPEESFKMLHSYLFMLEAVNPGTVTNVEVDENGKFKYLFIALGACIEGFRVMRKVIIVDATFVKNRYGGVLVFATAQDLNRHHYPIAFGVLDGENNLSWNWFLETLKTVVPDSSELVFVSDRHQSIKNAIEAVYPQAHHGHCIWHLSQNVKLNVPGKNEREVLAWRFIELSRLYTVAEFNSVYEIFKTRYPVATDYLKNSTSEDKWARSIFPGDRYNLDTSNSVESLNSVFKDARKYYLLPMVDTIVRKFFDWFNEHQKDAVSGSIDNKLVPLVENTIHTLMVVAEKLIVREVNSYELDYEVTFTDGKLFLVNLVSKTCSCREFDIEKYPCVHALAAYVELRRHGYGGIGRGRDIKIELHELCSKYYWTELWAMAYYKSIYVVPDKSAWNVPDYIKNLQIIPPDRVKRKGRNIVNRFPSVGERRRRTQNKRRPRHAFGLQWWLFGNGSSPAT